MVSESPRNSKRPRLDQDGEEQPSQLEQLKRFTSVVADTGDFAKIREFKPDDATTNPSLILQAVSNDASGKLLAEAIASARTRLATGSPRKTSAGNSPRKSADMGAHGERLVEEVIDELCVAIGSEIAKAIEPRGRVSTEVDARFSFDTENSVKKALKLIGMYEAKGITKDRILIKLATTWEGVEACRILQNEHGIDCNMTLLFSLVQAAAAAEAKAFLISPFVGRILDWNVKNGVNFTEDPGVVSVREIFNYYKTHGYKTVVMGASFRNKDEILALAGCDKLTIAPKLLEELKSSKEKVERKLSPEIAHGTAVKPKIAGLDEKKFRWTLNEDAMATEKLAEGIRNFEKDTEKLRTLVRAKIAELGH